MAESATSQAWARLAERHSLQERLARGEVVPLSAQEIKEVGGREPRLMTKFDTRESRPPQLAGATVLPVTNGSYVVLPGDGYHDLAEVGALAVWPLPKSAASLRTLPWSTGPSSESQALDMALASGLLGAFLDDPGARLTVRGRRRAPRFEFDFRCAASIERVVVEGVQIEVDAGLEGEGVHLVEGKLGARRNFHIRQLYYPLQMWRREITQKEVSAVFMTWHNRRFELRRYAFDPADRYHAIRLVKALDYVLDDEDEAVSLPDLVASARPEPLPGAPFPQADDMRKLIDVVDAVGSGAQDKVDIAEKWSFDQRQADYYGNAAVFLGLLTRSRRGFALAPLGAEFVASGVRQRTSLLARRMASVPVLRAVVTHYVERGELPEAGRVAEWITEATGLSGSTPERRASTALAWVRWLAGALTEPREPTTFGS